MRHTLTPQEIKDRLKTLEQIYAEYNTKMENIRGRQRQLLIDFIKTLEQEKLEAIRQSLKNN